MSGQENLKTQDGIKEIESLVTEFLSHMKERVQDVEQDLQISEIENEWNGVRKKANNVLQELFENAINSIDEKALIAKKKENMADLE